MVFQVSTVTAGRFTSLGLSFPVSCKRPEPDQLHPELSNPRLEPPRPARHSC